MTAAPAGVNPFVGLRPFDRDDSLYYFGRREQTSELLEQLNRNRFLAVVGSSGCGKSSLIRAGLIPALFGGFLVDERDHWLIAIMKPGDAPTLNLASALCALTGSSDAAALEKAINEEQADAVVDFMRETLGSETNLLILVDQFEEIFAFRGVEDDEQLEAMTPALRRERGHNRAEAANFVDLLLALAPAELPIYVVLTMRSDFLGDCELFYGLPEAMNQSRYLVPRLTRQQLREAVQGPALLSGVRVSPRLLDTVLNDLGGSMDQLPVLQHALFRTWNEWAKTMEGPLDLQHYQAIGQLRGALSQHATEAMRSDDLAETARLFKGLTDTDPNQRRIRRPAHLKELVALCGGATERVEAVIERFRSGGRNFLVISNARDGDRRIDISHESLIRQWPQLREWIDAERISRDQYLELLKGARSGRALLQNPDLGVAVKWRNENSPTAHWARRYSSGDGDFAAAMKYLTDSQEEAAAALQKKRRLQRVLWSTTGLVIVVLSALTWYAFQARAKAVLAQEKAVLAQEKAVKEQAKAAKAEERARLAEDLANNLKAQVTAYSSVIEAAPTAVSPPAQTSTVLRGMAPPSPVTLVTLDRSITYSNVSLNRNGNAIVVAPGEVFTVSFRWKGSAPKAPYCPGCYVQLYYGIGSKAGSTSNCFISDQMPAGWSQTGEVKGTLAAPREQGAYFITQSASLEYNCEEKKASQSGEKKDAIAAIEVR